MLITEQSRILDKKPREPVCEDAHDAIMRFYDTGDPVWSQVCAGFSDRALTYIDFSLRSKMLAPLEDSLQGKAAFAAMTGGFARGYYRPDDWNKTISEWRGLRDVYAAYSRESDYPDVLRALLRGPFDLDIRANCKLSDLREVYSALIEESRMVDIGLNVWTSAPSYMDRMVVEYQNDIRSKLGQELHPVPPAHEQFVEFGAEAIPLCIRQQNDFMKLVLVGTGADPDFFTIDLGPLPNPNNQRYDNRSGSNSSTKQNVRVYCVNTSMDSRASRPSLVRTGFPEAYGRSVLDQKSAIPNPTGYVNFGQAASAGLRLAMIEQMYPAIGTNADSVVTDNISDKTLEEYRPQLLYWGDRVRSGKDDTNMYRRQEIMQNVLLNIMLGEKGIPYLAALGIVEVFADKGTFFQGNLNSLEARVTMGRHLAEECSGESPVQRAERFGRILEQNRFDNMRENYKSPLDIVLHFFDIERLK